MIFPVYSIGHNYPDFNWVMGDWHGSLEGYVEADSVQEAAEKVGGKFEKEGWKEWYRLVDNMLIKFGSPLKEFRQKD